MPNWIDTTADRSEYDTFIRVEGMANVNISANSFSAAGTNSDDPASTYATFSYLVNVVRNGQAVFMGSVRSGGSPSGDYGSAPVHVGNSTGANPGFISYSIRDLKTGGSQTGTLGYTAATPDMRGVSLSQITSYQGYTAVDNGPFLQLSQPQLADASAVLFADAVAGVAINVSSGVRYLVVNVPSTLASAFIINLQPNVPVTAQNHLPLTVVFIGNTIANNKLTWQYGGAAGPPMGWGVLHDHYTVGTQVELLFRGGASGPLYYLLSQVTT